MHINKKLIPFVAGLALFCPLALSHHINVHADISPYEYEQQMRNDEQNLDNQIRFQDYVDQSREQAQERYDNATPAQRRAWRKMNEEIAEKSQERYDKSQQEQSETQSIISAQDSEDNKVNKKLWKAYIQDGGNISTVQSPNTNTSIREEAYTPTNNINNNYVHYYSDGSINYISEPYWPDDPRAVVPSNAKFNTLNHKVNNKQTTWTTGDDTSGNDILYYIGDGLWSNENDMLSLKENYDLDIPTTDDGFPHMINGSKLPGQVNLSENIPSNASITPYETSLMDKANGVNYAPTNTSVPTSTVLSMSPASSSYSQPSSVSSSSDSSEDDQDLNSDNSSNDNYETPRTRHHKHHAIKPKKYNERSNRATNNRRNIWNSSIKKQISLNKKLIKNDKKHLSTWKIKRFLKLYNEATKFINHHKKDKHAKRLMKKVMAIKSVKRCLYYYKDEIKHENELNRLIKRINKKRVHKSHNRKRVKRSHKFARHHRRSHKHSTK